VAEAVSNSLTVYLLPGAKPFSQKHIIKRKEKWFTCSGVNAGSRSLKLLRVYPIFICDLPVRGRVCSSVFSG
jgi:hypothetical protein